MCFCNAEGWKKVVISHRKDEKRSTGLTKKRMSKFNFYYAQLASLEQEPLEYSSFFWCFDQKPRK